jgi:Tfp pilus assembly protein PilV
MAVKPANTYTASQVAALAKLKTTPLNQVNKLQKDTSRQNVTEAKVADLRQTNRVATLNKGYEANPAAYVSAAKNSNLDLAKINPAAYAAEQKKLAPKVVKQNPLTKTNPNPSYLQFGNTKAKKTTMFAKGGMMSKGGVAASKMGAVKTASPSRDGIASKGKTKGKNLGNSGKSVGIMRGARRAK